MLQLAPGWDLTVERGPDWLFVRVRPPVRLSFCDTPPLAESVWELLQQQFSHRVVVELDDVHLLSSYLIGQLILLHKRVSGVGGIMRLSGVSEENRMALRMCRLDDRLPTYTDRTEAVMGGFRPRQPR